MIRGTTPDYVLTVKGADLTDKTVYVTIAQSVRKRTKTGGDLLVSSDGTDSTVAFSLSQEDSLFFAEGAAEVQVKFIDSTGKAEGTDIGAITVDRALYEKVIEYVPDD